MILNLKITGKNAINSAKTTTDVTKALDDAKAEVDKVKTIAQELLDPAKTNAINELANYKVNVKNDYSSTNWTKIDGFKADGVIAINASNTTAAVAQALANAKMAIDAIKTLVEEQDLVDAEAAKIPLTFFASNPVGTVSLPTVGTDYVISVQSTTDSSKYDADGKVQADGTSTVIYTVTHTASGKTSNTGPVVVTVFVVSKSPVYLDIGSSTISNIKPVYSDKIEFHFSDDPVWMAAVNSITYTIGSWNGYQTAYQISTGRIIITNFVYGPGVHVWTIKATGYPDTIVTVEVQ